jgi:very-short-patch-repair endonuclease
MHEQPILALAARQHGLAHRKQLSELGVTESALRRSVDRGRWHWRTSHVLQVAGSPPTIEQDAMLAVLDLNPDGAALCLHSAAARWGVPGFSIRPFHVMGNRVRGRNHSNIAIVHQPRLLLPEDVLTLGGIPIVSPTLTLFHLAGVLRWPQQVERALDNALAASLTSVPLLQRTLKRYARRGRAGIALMRTLIDARLDHYVPHASGMESRFDELASKCWLRDFVRQVNVGDEYDWLGRVDFVDRKRKIIVEVQSARFHSSLLDTERDKARIAALRAAGWIVVEVTEHDLWHNPEKVLTDLRAARDQSMLTSA